MPMTYTAEMVKSYLERLKLSTDGTEEEVRERYAQYVEDRFGDWVDAWEIRTGRPWNSMTRQEAADLIAARPTTLCNPGVLSRLMGGG